LVEDVSLGAMIHAFHNLFLSIYLIIGPFFENVALKVILMIGLPRLRTHIAKALSTGACHKIASHTSFDSLFAPWTYFSVIRDPLCIRFFFQYLFHPFGFFLAFARVVVIALASETKDFSAYA
jgi:hypothetical protein